MVAGLKNNNVHAKNLNSSVVPSYRTRLLLGRPLYNQHVCFVRRLYRHPQIEEAGRKEKHWFDLNRFIQNQHSVKAYSNLFEDFASKVKDQPQKVMGDYTVTYLSWSLYWKCYQVCDGGLYCDLLVSFLVLEVLPGM